MRFETTDIPGVMVITPEPVEDERGFFARTFCREKFAARGLVTDFAQADLSLTCRRGTLRGLHFQAPPALEAKLVSCLRGRILDVAVDVRTGSPVFGRVVTVELSATPLRSLYLPEGVAHGFQTIEDDCLVSYHISVPYRPALARGVRFDDPTLAVPWPICPPALLSARDRALPLLAELLTRGELPQWRG